jgi:hypothetical protein
VLLLVALCQPVQPFQAQSSGLIAPGPLHNAESLRYNIEWRLITAGKAHLTWASSGSGFQAGLDVESAGLVSKLFKVNDEYSAAMDRNLCAHTTLLKTSEGSRHRETKIIFDQEHKKASYSERDVAKNTVLATKEIDVPGCVSDIIGALYRMRTLDMDLGQSRQIPVSDGKKSAMVRVEAQQRDQIKTPAGVFKAIRYEAFLFNNVIYGRSGRVYVWLTEDARRLPVQIQVRLQLHIGTITLQLEKEGA